MARRKDWLNGTPGKKQVCRLYWPENNNLGMYILFETESKKIIDAKTYRRDGTESAVSLLLKASNILLKDALGIWETNLLLPDPIVEPPLAGVLRQGDTLDGTLTITTTTGAFVHISGDVMTGDLNRVYSSPIIYNGAMDINSTYSVGAFGYRPPGIYPITSGGTTTVYGSNNYRVEYEEYEENEENNPNEDK